MHVYKCFLKASDVPLMRAFLELVLLVASASALTVTYVWGRCEEGQQHRTKPPPP